MLSPKVFIGPMSKNIVDCIIEKNNEYPIALIPSRRQVDFDGGYVNNWTTKSFNEYVKSKNSNVIICRDHSGPSQGAVDDDGYESLTQDCHYCDIIHIDPWKAYSDFEQGIIHTADMISHCLKINKQIKFEIGTEEAIKYFDSKHLRIMCNNLRQLLGQNFDSITHIVIQSGTALKGNNQIGSYDHERLVNMIEIVKDFDKLSKEHNGDYLSSTIRKEKFTLGLDSINIAPEFGLIETNTILEACDDILFDKFFDICYNSKKWVKWVDKDFNPFMNKIELVQICGHYVFSNAEFIEQILPYVDVQKRIVENINNKLDELNV